MAPLPTNHLRPLSDQSVIGCQSVGDCPVNYEQRHNTVNVDSIYIHLLLSLLTGTYTVPSLLTVHIYTYSCHYKLNRHTPLSLLCTDTSSCHRRLCAKHFSLTVYNHTPVTTDYVHTHATNSCTYTRLSFLTVYRHFTLLLLTVHKRMRWAMPCHC